MKRVLIFCNSDRHFRMLEETRERLAQKDSFFSQSQSLFFSPTQEWSPIYEKAVSQSDFVIFAWQGVIYDSYFADKALEIMKSKEIFFGVLSFTDPETGDFQGIAKEEMEKIRKYLSFSGEMNYINLWRFAQTKCNGASESVQIEEPQKMPWMGIYHPSSAAPYTDLQKYLQEHSHPGYLKIGLLFSRESWIWKDLHYINEIIAELESRHIDAIPLFCLWERKIDPPAPGIVEGIRNFFYDQGNPIVSAAINTFKVGMTRSRQNTPDFLQNLNIPILQGQNILRSLEEWQNTLVGMTPVELAVNIVEPEFDGAIHGEVVSSKEVASDAGYYYRGVGERIAALADKAEKWGLLRAKKNQDKKIALILHNYPPSNDSIGTAQGLDSLESAAWLIREMENAGYFLDHVPQDGQELIQEILASATNDRRFISEEQMDQAVGRVSAGEYQEWFRSLSPSAQENLIQDWGLPPGAVFLHEDHLLVPGIMNGNVMVSVQPPRGFGEDSDKILHSPTCPPPHHYFAYYFWMREIWQADAVIHLGTHGSLEWLPGKNAGLSKECCPEMALGDLPNVYPYYTTIVGEGLQAKRRSSACLIGHLCPPMDRAELYEELAELEKVLDEYAHFKTGQSDQAALIVEEIIEKVEALHLDEDIPRWEEENRDDYVLRVHCYLEKLKQMQIRVGLHVLGKVPEGDSLMNFVLALTRSDNQGIPSLPKTIAAQMGFDYYEILEKSGEMATETKSYADILTAVWSLAEAIVDRLHQEQFDRKGIDGVWKIDEVKSLFSNEEERAELQGLLQYICETLVPNLQRTSQEILNTLRALNGEYIEPAIGGAPTSGQADILPTGRNFYGVDPNQLPTPSAWKIGSELAEQMVSRFILEEGHYPESVGMVFWASENIRTQGKCLSEFFKLLGIRPIWQKGSRRVIDLEVIPLSELKRPRIDGMARISGLYRDSLPKTVEWMEKAVQIVSSLDEPWEMNFIKKHVEEDIEELQKEGRTLEEARSQAQYRIFGCPPGGYGSGVASMLEEKNWRTVDDLADVYVRWGAHAYGKENQGEFLPEMFRKRLGQMEITVKNIDNHEVHLLNSDDFNSYCGGMNAAVKSIRGALPRCYIGDSTDSSHVELKSLAEEFRRVFRGESLNPKYIEGMKKHGYKGASDLASLVSRSYGWDATSEVMKDWMYEGLANKLALNEEIQAWMKEVNPWALQRMSEKLLEAEQRGLWNAPPEMKKELENLYLSLEGDLEEKADLSMRK